MLFYTLGDDINAACVDVFLRLWFYARERLISTNLGLEKQVNPAKDRHHWEVILDELQE